jgi:hypothetical protein
MIKQKNIQNQIGFFTIPKTNLCGFHFQASKRTEINQNELIIRILHRLPRPVWNFPGIGLDLVPF